MFQIRFFQDLASFKAMKRARTCKFCISVPEKTFCDSRIQGQKVRAYPAMGKCGIITHYGFCQVDLGTSSA